MLKVLKANRKPEPSAKVFKHMTQLRTVSRKWKTYIAKLPVDLLFSSPVTTAQALWLAKSTHAVQSL